MDPIRVIDFTRDLKYTIWELLLFIFSDHPSCMGVADGDENRNKNKNKITRRNHQIVQVQNVHHTKAQLRSSFKRHQRNPKGATQTSTVTFGLLFIAQRKILLLAVLYIFTGGPTIDWTEVFTFPATKYIATMDTCHYCEKGQEPPSERESITRTKSRKEIVR